MRELTTAEALKTLSALMKAVEQGEKIIVVSEDEKLIQPITVQSLPQPRKAGSAKGTFFMADDFDAPIEDFEDYWATEAERRVQEIASNQVQTIPAEEVFRALRNRNISTEQTTLAKSNPEQDLHRQQ